jgi:hypothetical protein
MTHIVVWHKKDSHPVTCGTHNLRFTCSIKSLHMKGILWTIIELKQVNKHYITTKQNTQNLHIPMKLKYTSLMFVPCIVRFGITDQHYALTVTLLFITQAPTCFSILMPSSGSVLYPSKLLERQKWWCCSLKIYHGYIIILIMHTLIHISIVYF